MLVLAAMAGMLLKRPNAWRQFAGLLLCMAAFVVAVNMAMNALAHRRVNSHAVAYAATMIPSGETVTINVANLPPWRAMISWWGVVAVLFAAALLVRAALFLRRAGEKRIGSGVVGAVLLSAGLLAQRGGAIAFFGAAAAGIFIVLGIPAIGSLAGALRARIRAGGAIHGATATPLIIAAGMIGILLSSAPPSRAAAEAPHAESIVQTWKIDKDRLYGEMDLRIRGVAGDSYLLLNPPAVMTGFQGDGLHVTKLRRNGQTAYYVAPERDGLLTAHVTFEMPARSFERHPGADRHGIGRTHHDPV